MNCTHMYIPLIVRSHCFVVKIVFTDYYICIRLRSKLSDIVSARVNTGADGFDRSHDS